MSKAQSKEPKVSEKKKTKKFVIEGNAMGNYRNRKLRNCLNKDY